MKAILILFCLINVIRSDNSFYVQMVKRTALRIIDKSVGNDTCGTDLKIFLDALTETETWAMEMLDASEKVQTGLLYGNIRVTGNYDECMAIRTFRNESYIQGKYCLYGLHSNVSDKKSVLNINEQLTKRGITFDKVEQYLNYIHALSAMCVPLSCTDDDLRSIWNYTKYYFGLQMELKFNDSFCDYEGRVVFQKKDVIAIAFFVVLVLIILASTLYDVAIFRKQKAISCNIWTSFSLYSNGKKLFYVSKKENDLCCLHGIRVISMMWIILCHEFMINIFSPNVNGIYIFKWKNHLENMIVFGGTVAVDTFFVLSGLLVVYIFMCAKESGVKFNLIIFYLHRFLRLTPSLAALTVFILTLFRYVGNGPYWHIIYEIFERQCQKYWWTTLLYIQNTYGVFDQCVPHGWYLSVDTQLYFLAPLLLFPLLKWPKKTIVAVILLIFFSMMAAFIITWANKLGAMPYETDSVYYKYIYQSTFIRSSAWNIGALLGYALFKTKNVTVVIRKWTNISLWLLSIGIMLWIVLGQVTFTRNAYDVLKSSLFNTFARPMWSLCLSYIIFACVKGHGGIVNKFLSLPVFRMLSRLTYSMYLMHLGVLGVAINNRRTVTYFNNMTILIDFWGYYVCTIFYSVIWTLIFESPILNIEKMLFLRGNSEEKTLKDGNFKETLTVIDILSAPDASPKVKDVNVK